MSHFSQPSPRSINPIVPRKGVIEASVDELEALPEPIVAHHRELRPGDIIPRHDHRRAQLLYASDGVMSIGTDEQTFVVPPNRAVWMPGRVAHRVEARSAVSMRTLYIEPPLVNGLPSTPAVLNVTPLLRELLVEVARGPRHYPTDSPQARLMGVVLDQLHVLPQAGLALPMPADSRLRRITDPMMLDPSDNRPMHSWAKLAGMSERTMARAFRSELGMSFGTWRAQCRLLRAMERLATGLPVTTVALDLGYESTSAFIAMFRRAVGTTPRRYFAEHNVHGARPRAGAGDE